MQRPARSFSNTRLPSAQQQLRRCSDHEDPSSTVVLVVEFGIEFASGRREAEQGRKLLVLEILTTRAWVCMMECEQEAGPFPMVRCIISICGAQSRVTREHTICTEYSVGSPGSLKDVLCHGEKLRMDRSRFSAS
jgi:hypothetical protein